MLLFPIVRWLENHKVPGFLAILISIIFFLSLLAGLIWFFASQITNITKDFTDIKQHLEQIITQFQSFMTNQFGVNNVLDLQNINNQFASFIKANASTISGFAFSTLGFLAIIVITLVYIIMFLVYRDHFVGFAIKLFKKQPPEHVVEVLSDLRSVIQHYLTGVLKVMIILATMHATVLMILGVKHAIFFAIFVSILYIVPYIGPGIGIGITMLFTLLTKESFWYPLGVVVLMVFNQALEANFLTPKVVGSNVKINPITALVALFAGELIWGIAGMIIFIPLAAILKKLLELSPTTEVYGFLMGEKVSKKKPARKKHGGGRLNFIFNRKRTRDR